MTLVVNTRASEAKRILEVGCGSGMHTMFFAKTLLKKGGAIVCTDLSERMMFKCREKFEDKDFSSGFSDVKGNSFEIRDEEVLPFDNHSFDLEEEVIKRHLNVLDLEGKLVFGCKANNESLPFKDETFDCYIANLSLQIVEGHKNMLSEALRVVKPGSILGFTVWGRRENFVNFQILEEILEKYGGGPKEPPKRTNYDRGANPELLK